MVSEAANHFYNVIFGILRICLDGPICEAGFNSLVVNQEGFLCVFLSEATVQVNLLIEKIRVRVHYFERIKSCLEEFNPLL